MTSVRTFLPSVLLLLIASSLRPSHVFADASTVGGIAYFSIRPTSPCVMHTHSSSVFAHVLLCKTNVQIRTISKGGRGGVFASRRLNRNNHHSVCFGDGAYTSQAFIWQQFCSSGFPPHPGPIIPAHPLNPYQVPTTTSSPATAAQPTTTPPTLHMALLPHSSDRGHFHCQAWTHIHDLHTSWQLTTRSFLNAFRICAMCGIAAFGGDTHTMHTSAADENSFPYLFRTPHVAPHSIVRMLDDGDILANVCASCHKTPHKHTPFIGCHCSQYVNRILSESRLINFQMLSIVDVSLNFRKTYMGHARCHLSRDPLISGALVDWALCPADRPDPHTFDDIFRANFLNNPLVRHFKTVSETNGCNSLGLSVLPPSTVTNIVQTHVDNAPTLWADEDDRPYTMSTLVPPHATLTSCSNPMSKRFHVGTCVSRHASTRIHPSVEPVELSATLDTIIRPDHTHVGSISPPTIEAAMFPFLFPDGKGFYDGKVDFHQYLKYRMNTLFSLYTLYTPYVSLMYQIKQSVLLLNSVNVVSLDRDLTRYRQQHPNATENQALQHVQKYAVPKTIPNSPQYHRNQLKNLLAMVDSFGMPNFFLTLTADEVSELRWPEYTDIESTLRDLFDNPDLDWKSAPVECTRIFKARVDAFLKEYIHPSERSGVLGKVLHYLVRYEFQDRGSPHVHIILWVDVRDESRVANEIIAYVPAAYDNNRDEFIPPTDPMQRRLYDVVMRKQQHTCRSYGKGCRKKGSCSKGFPVESNEGQTTFDNASKRFLYARPFVGRQGNSSANRNIVPYHPVVSLLWNAHANLLRITAEAWSYYVLKYATKMEPCGFLDIEPDLARRLNFSPDISEAQLKLITGAVLTKPVAPTEAAFNMLQYAVIYFSDTCHFVNTAPPGMRQRATLRVTTVCVPPVDKYCARPPHMEHETLTSFYTKYVLRDKALKSATRFRGQTSMGHFIYDAPRNFLVRFTDFHPVHQTEGYAYNLLLANVPFRHEHELFSPNNHDATYVCELRLRGFLTSEESVEGFADAYSTYHLYTDDARQHLYEALLVNHDAWGLNGMGDSDDTDATDIPHGVTLAVRGNLDSVFREMRRADDTTSAPVGTDAAPADASTLTPTQRALFDRLVQPDCRGLHAILGSPGAGKTYMTKLLIDTFTAQRRNVILSASTGIAATRLHTDARSIHHTFFVPVNGFLTTFLPTHPRYAQLKDADVIIIDEISMMTAQTLRSVMYRIAQVLDSQNPSVYMNQKLIILVGDLCQLPPVCNHRLNSERDVCTTCHITSNPHWPVAEKHRLETSYRHANDPVFAAFLNRIRLHPVDQSAVDEVLADCYISREDVHGYIHPNTTILCSHCERTDEYNRMAMGKLFPPTDVAPVCARVSHPPDVDLLSAADRQWYHTWMTDPKFHRLPLIAVGAKVMLTTNMTNLENGANGDVGYITSWRCDSDGNVQTISVYLTRPNKTIRVCRTLSKQTTHSCGKYRKTTFPLALAYAMTGHKSQGATLCNTTVIHIDSAFVPGQAYVMLSRMTERRHLRIVGTMKAANIVPVPPYITSLFL